MPYNTLEKRRANYRKRRADLAFLKKYRAYQRNYLKNVIYKDPSKLEKTRAYQREWARAHRRKLRGEMFGKRRRMKTDAQKRAALLARKKRYWNKNRTRINARTKEKRLLDPERFRKVDRARYRRDPENRQHQSRIQRAKRTGLDCYISLQEWKKLLTAFNFRCAYCRVLLTKQNRSLDHKVPLVRGGTNDISNLVPSCLRCNQRKNKLTAEEFQRISAFQ